jgi:hydroxyacylglutathione hydrolase
VQPVIEVHGFTGGPFAENTYLLVAGDGRNAVLVDPGAAAVEALIRAKENDLRIRAILLTHAHLDHVDGLPTVREHTEAPIYLHPDDERLYAAVAQQAAAFGLEVGTLPPVDEALSHGQALEFPGISLSVRHSPGHAPGHVIFVSEGDDFAVVGDVVFAGSIGRTDLPGGNLATLMASIRREVLSLPDTTRLFPGHGPETTVRRERIGNPFLIPHYGGELA